MSIALRCTCLMSARRSKGRPTIRDYLNHLMWGDFSLDIKIVPILVGAIDYDQEVSFGRLLAPYLARDDTIFVVSSDFCHW